MKDNFFSNMQTMAEFEDWKNRKDEQITLLQGKVYEPSCKNMDYSLESLEFLVYWLLNQYATLEEAHNVEDIQVVDAAARYVGETFIKHLGGHWAIDLEDDMLMFFGVPSIINFKSNGTGAKKIYPRQWTTATIGRRTPFILERFNHQLKKIES